MIASPATVSKDGDTDAWWNRAPGNSYGVLIPETRASPTILAALNWLIADTLRKVPPTWTITVYHLRSNAERMQAYLGGWTATGRVFLQQQTDPSLSDVANDNQWTNRVMYTTAWWDSIRYPKFLLLQTDAIICRERDWEFLGNLTQFDYAGAPWGGPPPFDKLGGNGGFSWRGKAAHLKVLNDYFAAAGNTSVDTIKENEDTFFSRGINNQQPAFNVAPRAMNCRFAVETIYCNPTPFGMHKAWIHSAGRSSFENAPRGRSFNGSRGDDCEVHPFPPLYTLIASLFNGAV